ncbi:MAG: hypothetical protein KDK38_14165, partial [Leptospiraceae bacterium]|nr:hypothetical protein [Leptospiraceae bacterium]
MSRLTRHQKKQFRMKITVYIVLLIATLAILAVYGLRTIVSGTIYISSLFGSAKTEDVIKEESFFGRITLEEPPEATSEASIELRGSATDFEKITLYLNDTEAAEITLPKDSQQFTKTIDGLEPGANTIYAEAFNSEKKEKRTSDTYTVSYLADAPSLTVTAPSESTETVGSA